MDELTVQDFLDVVLPDTDGLLVECSLSQKVTFRREQLRGIVPDSEYKGLVFLLLEQDSDDDEEVLHVLFNQPLREWLGWDKTECDSFLCSNSEVRFQDE